MKATYKSLGLAFMMLVLLLPCAEKHLKIFPLTRFALSKTPDPDGAPALNLTSFLAGSYQDTLSPWMDLTMGFHPLLVRMRNQIDYSCFRVTHGKVISGKDDYLFLDEFVNGFTGANLDKELFAKRMDTLEAVKNYLMQRNIPFLYIIAPGKASFCKQNLPGNYTGLKRDSSAYALITNAFKMKGIPYVDLNAYFDALKTRCPYPLFSKLGTHWSVYGAALALDTIYKKAAQTLNFVPCTVNLDSVTISSKKFYPEDDLAEVANLLFIPDIDTLAYPHSTCNAPGDTTLRKPKILFIGDSYTYIFGFTDLPGQLFAKGSKYWFYMREEKDLLNLLSPGRSMEGLNLVDSIRQFDMVIILSTESRYDRGDYGLFTKLNKK